MSELEEEAAGVEAAVDDAFELGAFVDDDDVSLEVFAPPESLLLSLDLLSLLLPSDLLSPALPSPPAFGFELP